MLVERCKAALVLDGISRWDVAGDVQHLDLPGRERPTNSADIGQQCLRRSH